MSSATYYAWKGKVGGLEVSDAKRLRALEDENAKLKRLLADAMLDNAGLKDLLTKKWQRAPRLLNRFGRALIGIAIADIEFDGSASGATRVGRLHHGPLSSAIAD